MADRTGQAECERVDFNATPSLQRMVAVQVVIELYKQAYVQVQASNELQFYLNDRDTEWLNELTKSVLESISHFGPSAQELERVYDAIGWQIFRWIHTHVAFYKDFNNSGLCFLDHIRWTTCGSIDQRRTTEYFLDNTKQVDVLTRFRLACADCCEQHLIALWSQIDWLDQLADRYNYKRDNFLLAYWTILVPDADDNDNGDLPEWQWRKSSDRIDDDLETGFFNSVDDCFRGEFLRNQVKTIGNKIKLATNIKLDSDEDCGESLYYDAMLKFASNSYFELGGDVDLTCTAYEYFWHKLTELEQLKLVTNCACRLRTHSITSCRLLIFLLRHSNAVQQQLLFGLRPDLVLDCVAINWQIGHLFLDTIDKMWQHVSGDTFSRCLTNSISFSHLYQYTFSELWNRSPLSLRKHVITYDDKIICNLMARSSDFNLQLVLRDADQDEKRQFLFSDRGRMALNNLLAAGQTRLFDAVVSTVLWAPKERSAFVERLQISRLIKLSNGGFSLHFDKFCADNFPSHEALCRFKEAVLVDTCTLDLIFAKLLSTDSWECVDVFQRFFFATESELVAFRERFVFAGNDVDRIPMLVYMAILKDARKGVKAGDDSALDKLLCYLIPTEEAKVRFRKDFLVDGGSSGGLGRVISGLLAHRRLDLATNFLKWLFSSSEQISRFKNEFLLSNFGLQRIHVRLNEAANSDHFFNPQSYTSKLSLFEYVGDLLDWYKLTAELIVELKARLCVYVRKYMSRSEYQNVYETFLKILDDFASGNLRGYKSNRLTLSNEMVLVLSAAACSLS